MTALAHAPAVVGAGGHGPLTGTGRLTRFALRRDRIRIPAWALGIAGLIGYFSLAIPAVYPDAAALQTRADIMRDPSGAMMTGPGYGLDDYTFGVMLANEMLGMIAVGTALMSIFLVVRHTRAEEETGRSELLRAGVVGRHAPLTAALLTVLVANLAVAAVLMAVLLGNELPTADSLAFVSGVALVGLVFGAVAAVTAQLGEHARSASGTAGAVLGLAYVLRGVGDAQQSGGSTLSWMSPIGWAQQTRVFVDLRWTPLLLCVGLTAVLVVLAYRLSDRRDVGAGLVAARRGRADAPTTLLHPVGLGLRLERAGIIGWSVGLFVFAVLTGSMAEAIATSMEEQPELARVFGALGEDVLLVMMAAFLGFFAMAVAVYAVTSVNRLRREEGEGRTGALLATPLSRVTWVLSAVTVTVVGSTVLLLVSGFGLGGGAAGVLGRPEMTWDFTVAALAYLPVVLCFAGLAVVGNGVRGLGTWWVWLLLVASILVGLYGPLLNLPQSVLDVAPFGLVPAVPGAALDVAPLAWMTVVAALLVAAGTTAFRRRDLTA